MPIDKLKTLIVDALEDLKAIDLVAIDVSDKSSFTDLMVVASGSSTRQVKALADNVVECTKKAGIRPLGIEGERDAEWILVDLGDAVVHIMLPTTRDFYSLEKLWSVSRGADAEAEIAATRVANG